jgi:hypothetical protein
MRDIQGQYLMPTQSLLYAESAAAVFQSMVAMQVVQQHYLGVGLAVFDLDEVKRDIMKLATLSKNWDGYGALPIHEQTRRNALAAADLILQWAPSPADVGPNSNGTISFEWVTEFGTAQLEIGFTRCSFYIDRTGSASFFWDGSADQIAPQLGVMISSALFPPLPGTAATTVIGSV